MKNKWTERWTPDQAAAVSAQVMRATAPVGPFGSTDKGLHDLRGVKMPLGGMTVRGLQVTNLDFSSANLDTLVLIGGRIDKSDFSETQLRLLNNASEVASCRFDRALMATSAMTGAARFFDCTFTGADLTGGQFKQGIIEQCDFAQATLNKLDVSATLRNCHFAGHISQTFLRSKIEGCDFTAASFVDCALYGAVFQDCKFGPDTINIANWPSSLRVIAEAKATSALTDKAREKLERKLRVWAQTLPQVRHQVIDLQDLIEADGKEVGPVLFNFFRNVIVH